MRGQSEQDCRNTKEEGRRVSSRLPGFGLTQRPVQRLGGGRKPFPSLVALAPRRTVIPPLIIFSLQRRPEVNPCRGAWRGGFNRLRVCPTRNVAGGPATTNLPCSPAAAPVTASSA